jgi:hypothetical protein
LTVGSNVRSRCELVHISGCKFLRSIANSRYSLEELMSAMDQRPGI